jgi:hypothetical protein
VSCLQVRRAARHGFGRQWCGVEWFGLLCSDRGAFSCRWPNVRRFEITRNALMLHY